MASEFIVTGVVVTPHRGVHDRSVHAFDLAVRPRMIDLRQTMFDAIFNANAVEDMSAVVDVSSPVGELNAIVGENRMEAERHRSDEVAQELCSSHLAGFPDQADKGELGYSANRNKEIPLALTGSQLRNVDVDVSDRVAFEFALRGCLAAGIRQAADPMALRAATAGSNAGSPGRSA